MGVSFFNEVGYSGALDAGEILCELVGTGEVRDTQREACVRRAGMKGLRLGRIRLLIAALMQVYQAPFLVPTFWVGWGLKSLRK